ncbi:hydroxylysine kinase isoform X1 [Nomia melanderi]|uniref:hydroxylysine kinase isoform X1 n=1 Tax=Nomia melanderi TaxID=2448451 RepID=UPI0013043AC8|nr:hydroxylysine kinase [Nomia melanderi]XP_031832464.1 hydroxylysine kinase [Nomia melanderi]
METNDGVLTPGQRIRPPGSEQIVLALLDKLYKLKAIKITELNAYDDRNYHVICEDLHENPHMTTISKNGYVLKIVNSLDSRKCRVIDAQNEILIFLNQRHINCPLPVKNVKGEYYSLETLTVQGYENSYAVRLLVYLPGVMLNRMSITSELLRNVGRFTSKLDTVLKGFSHSAYDNHKTLWMLTSVPDLRRFIYAVSNDYERDLAHQVIHAFEEDVLRVMPKLEQGIIHGDLNEQNIVVNSNGTEVTAVIDFGDTHRTCLIFELAITLCYMMLQAGDLAMGKYVIEGYQDIRKLTNLEKKILKVTVCARICQSLVMGAYSYLNDPQNDYLLVTQKSGWVLLKNLWPISQEEVLQRWGLTD